MKRCPFCAEEIQDAAIVCKHCGRDLAGSNRGQVTVARAPRRWPYYLLATVALLAVIGAAANSFFPSVKNAHDASGKCILRARLEAAKIDADVLKVTNLDDATWARVEVVVYGFGTANHNKGQATGAHRLRVELLGGVTQLTLKDFKKADESRWEPLVMRPSLVEIKAQLRGETCSYEAALE